MKFNLKKCHIRQESRASVKVGEMRGEILTEMGILIYGLPIIRQKPSLYRNNGDGTFKDIIDEVWDANPHADTHGVAWADFDNDGDQDLIVLSGGGGGTNATNPKHNNHFYVNENGMLLEKAAEFGISFPLLRGRSPLWFDWNRDGRLDLLVTGRVRPD